MRKFWVLFLFLFVEALILPGQSLASLAQSQTDKVKVEVRSAFPQFQKNKSFDVLVKITPQNGWHIYWDNPGDAGLPTQITWNLPEKLNVTELGHSAPKKYDAGGLILYGYGEPAYWKFRFNLEKNSQIFKNVDFELKVSWLACKEECVPETQRLKFSIPVEKKQKTEASLQWQDEALRAENSFPMRWKGKSFYDIQGNNLILKLTSKHKDLF